MLVVLLLGKDNKYLYNKTFKTLESAEEFVESIENLMLANIEKSRSLRERLDKYCPEYFPFSGAVQGVEIIDTNIEKKVQDL